MGIIFKGRKKEMEVLKFKSTITEITIHHSDYTVCFMWYKKETPNLKIISREMSRKKILKAGK